MLVLRVNKKRIASRDLYRFVKPLRDKTCSKSYDVSYVSIVKLQSPFLEYECTSGGKSVTQRVKGLKQREGRGPFPRGEEQMLERGKKRSSRARDSMVTPDWHCLQRALKRTVHIKSIIFDGQSRVLSYVSQDKKFKYQQKKAHISQQLGLY